MGKLNKTSTYLIGHMQYGDGTQWRNVVKAELEPRGVRCFDPYHKPFVTEVDESPETRDSLLQQMADGKYDEVAARMKMVRAYDLNLVDRCDFIVGYLDLSIQTCGTWEELFWSNRMKKPIFLVIEGGKKNTPLWMLGTIPHKFIYDSVDSALKMIASIDDGLTAIDSNRWRLLKEEFR